MEHLFLYGLIDNMEGHPLRNLLSAYGRRIGKGKCKGILHHFSDHDALLEGGNDAIEGSVYAIDDPDSAFQILDLSMGYDPTAELLSEFIRKTVILEMEDGTQLIAWVYYYNGKL